MYQRLVVVIAGLAALWCIAVVKDMQYESKIETLIQQQRTELEISPKMARELVGKALDGIQLRPNFLKPDMESVIKSRSTNNDIIFITAGFDYREVLANWIANTENQGISNWIICCFDHDIDIWLRERGSMCHIIVPRRLIQSELEIQKNRHCRGQEGYTVTTKTIELCMQLTCSGFYNTNCLGVSFTMNRHGQNGTCVKCVGNPQDEFVSGIPQPGTDTALFMSKNRIWHLRWLAAMDVMSLGLNVVFIDLDAIVVKNFFPLLHSLSDADVVAQRDFGPNKAVALWGNSICMGFSYWRVGTRKRHEIIKNVENILQRSGDDQSAVANALLIEGVRFKKELQPEDTETKIATAPSGYTLAMLPLTNFTRRCPDGLIDRSNQIIAHCIFGGSSARKKEVLKELGGWLLAKSWQPKGQSKTFSEFINRAVNSSTKQCYESNKYCCQLPSRGSANITGIVC